MSAGRLYRVAGVALVGGGALGVVAGLLAPSADSVRDVVSSPLFYPAAIGSVVAGILTTVSWPAMYARQHRQSGWLGLSGFVMVMTGGLLLAVAVPAFQLLAVPWLASLPISQARLEQGPAAFEVFFPIVGLILTAGGVLFGLGSLRARVFSRPFAVGFMGAAVLSLVFGFLTLPGPLNGLGQVVISLALGWAGCELLRRLDEAPSPTPAPGGRGQQDAPASPAAI
jgi:hypothetical protein